MSLVEVARQATVDRKKEDDEHVYLVKIVCRAIFDVF
jgi:hypothetical protein